MDQKFIEEINKILLDGEPSNISLDEHSGYTGYKPQYAVDAMNAVLWGKWGFRELSSEIVPGDKGPVAISNVEVWLEGMEFRPSSWGQGRVTRGDVGDAKKSAQTDALKKALSYVGVGARAYHGLLVKTKARTTTDAKPNLRIVEPTQKYTLQEVKDFFLKLYKTEEKWPGLKTYVLDGQTVADESLTNQQLASINAKLVSDEKYLQEKQSQKVAQA